MPVSRINVEIHVIDVLMGFTEGFERILRCPYILFQIIVVHPHSVFVGIFVRQSLYGILHHNSIGVGLSVFPQVLRKCIFRYLVSGLQHIPDTFLHILSHRSYRKQEYQY